MRRERLDMNFGWRYSEDFRPEYIRPDFKDTAFRLVDLPHSVAEWRDSAFEENCQRVCCYRKMFLLPAGMKGRRLILHFEGVMGCAAAFVNGKPVCAHKGGYTPFECDITEAVGENVRDNEILITVVVDSTEREDTAPYGGRGILHDGGIYREIWLEATDREYITDWRMSSCLEGDQWVLDFCGSISTEERREMKINIYDGEKKLGAKVVFTENGEFSTRWQPALKLEAWSPDNPRLYDFEITIGDEDAVTFKAGVRDSRFKPDGYYLNENKVKLIGFTRNQLYARAGAAAAAGYQRDDVKILKQLGCNFVRTGGFPPSQRFLDACDELGMLVFDEIPGSEYVGNDNWQECLMENLRELVRRDRSRTCVIMWSSQIALTTDDAQLSGKATQIIRELDPSRPIGNVRAVSGQQSISEDIYCFDDFSGSENGLERKKNIYKPRCPYLVVGHKGGRYEAHMADDTRLLEQALIHAKALNAAMGDPDIVGFCGGDLSDYPVHNASGSDGSICRSGVTDCSRISKPAAWLYQSQRGKGDFLELFPGLGSNGEIYVFTNCDSVRLKRNGKTVAEFKPARKQYPNLPHPPVIIDDFIGDLPCSEDGVEPRDLTGLKAQLLAMSRDGSLPADARMRSAMSVAAKFKMSAEELVRLYDKYCVGKNGTAAFTFEGLTNSLPTCVRVIAPVTEASMRVTCDRSVLVSDATYDCVRVELTVVDGSGNRLRDRFDAVSVDVDGSLEVIGSRLFSLSAGAAAFYVRTKGGKGPAKIKISTEAMGQHTVELDVTRIGKK